LRNRKRKIREKSKDLFFSLLRCQRAARYPLLPDSSQRRLSYCNIKHEHLTNQSARSARKPEHKPDRKRQQRNASKQAQNSGKNELNWVHCNDALKRVMRSLAESCDGHHPAAGPGHLMNVSQSVIQDA
jgi:hypothetical protein